MNKLSRAFIIGLAVASSILGASHGWAQSCQAPASWFPESQTPPVPLNFTPQSNCDFHLWAWQTFLWLMQDVDGRARFTTFPVQQDLFPSERPPGGLTRAKALASLEPPLRSASAIMKAKRPLLLAARVQKSSDPQGPDSIDQAFGGALDDQNGRVVYYSTFINDVFYDFVTKNEYTNLATYNSAPPATSFPPGSLELKAAWKVLSPGDSAAGFYTMEALVPQLTTGPKGIIEIDSSKAPVATQVALVGLHVVGVVADHPEFIWATFEHTGNAPDLAIVPSSKNWTFYAANTPATGCNQSANPFTLSGQVLSPILNVARAFPWGAPPNDNSPNTQNIKALNASVFGQLSEKSVLKNYVHIGGLWLLAPVQPAPPAVFNVTQNQKGSPLLANVTMETFFQFKGANCFSCHTTNLKSANGVTIQPHNMNVSHIMTVGLTQAAQQEHEAAALKAAAK